MATYLDRIVASHRAAAARDRRDPEALKAVAERMIPTRRFREALSRPDEVAVIAEIKRRSPHKGDLAPDLDPAVTAKAYHAGGAAALSVLTDSEFFAGSFQDLQAARDAVDLPVLRKDFTVGPADVLDARLMGADAVLLIVAALNRPLLKSLLGLAAEVSLDAVVEVHDENEANSALDAGATIVGVNQRDLYTFDVDTNRAARVARMLPEGVVKVAESGIRDADDVRRLADAGFDAVLVGESLVTSPDPAAAVAALRVARAAGPPQ